MKILCVSDYIDPLIYSTQAKKNFPDIDLILCAGDLPMDYIDFIVSVFNKPAYFVFGNHDLKEFKYYHREHFSPSETAGNALSALTSQNFRQKAAEHAHHNHGAIYTGFKILRLKQFKIYHPARKRATPLLICGASGSRNYNGGQCQYTESQMKAHLIRMIPYLLYNRIRYGRYLDIFLTHATPLGFHDMDDPCHKGFSSFNWFLKTFKPAYMIHGHIHLYDQRAERIGIYEKTTVVNAYAHHILEADFRKDYINTLKGGR